MRAIIKRFNGDERHVNVNIEQVPTAGDSFLLDPTGGFTGAQIEEFLDKEEGYSAAFKVVEVLWRTAGEPIIYLENAYKSR